MRIALNAIAFDAGTQIRAAIDEKLVADYAELMTNGTAFPPIVLFHDGNQHYIADGFHRFMAAQRNAFEDIDADVRAGTKDDALWCALGANRKNGKRLTSTDLQHAIRLAFMTWPDKSSTLIAEQVGCTHQWVSAQRSQVATACNVPDLVSGKDGKRYPSTKTRTNQREIQREQIITRLRAGEKPDEIAKAVHIRRGEVHAVKREIGMAERADTSKAAVIDRLNMMREMAASGNSSRQIADVVGLSFEGVRLALKRAGIDVPADRVIGRAHRHDSNRIIEHMVSDADTLTADVNLIVFAEVDKDRLGEWIDSLIASKKSLDSFIKRLVKEQQKHVEAA